MIGYPLAPWFVIEPGAILVDFVLLIYQLEANQCFIQSHPEQLEPRTACNMTCETYYVTFEMTCDVTHEMYL